jgi:hypothetical protein
MRKILLYMGVQIWGKISFKRKIALIFKLKTNIKSKKSYCSRKCLEEAGLLKVPEDEAGTSIRLPSFKRRDTDRNFCKMNTYWKWEKKAGSGRLAATVWKRFENIAAIDLRFWFVLNWSGLITLPNENKREPITRPFRRLNWATGIFYYSA